MVKDLNENTNRKVIYDVLEALRDVKADSNFSKRKIYSTLYRNANTLIDREVRDRKLYNDIEAFYPLCIELEEVDRNQCACAELAIDCKIMRSKNKLPKLITSIYGPVIQSISTVDILNTKNIILTTPTTAALRSKMKGNTNVYVFIQNEYLYLVNRSWESLTVNGLYEEEAFKFDCGYDKCKENINNDCSNNWLDQKTFIPKRLLGPTVQVTIKELLSSIGIPEEQLNDKSKK